MKAEKELRKSRNSLRSAKKETDTILENVEEGIFILDEKFRIGSQHSSALKEILNQKKLGQRTLIEVFEECLNADTLENVEDYLELQFNSSIDEETLSDLNPLSSIKMSFQKEHELFSIDKVLTFKFRRIYLKNKISGLIATVTDITEKVRLAKKLEESEEQSKKQMEWFLSLLHIEPELLKEFIDGAHKELNDIEQFLKVEEPSEKFQVILEKIYRSVHLIKGNASLLDLKYYAKKAHNFEEKIEKLQKQELLLTRDFIPLVIQLSEMRSDIDEIHKMIERISQLHTHFRPKRSFESKMLIKSIENLINTVAKDYNKEVKFIHHKFNGEQVPYEYRLIVKDVLVQMVRNSLRHGIELPEERERKGKSSSGSIEICSFSNNGEFSFRFRDDGRGLQIGILREKLIASGKWPDSEIAVWDDDKIAQSIYISGISTAESADIVAGRGVGMGIIWEKIKSHKGIIDFDHEEDKFLEFNISLPLSHKSKVKEKEKVE